MIKAIVFDFFGLVRVSGQIDQALLDYVAELKQTYKTALLSNVIGLDKYFDLNQAPKYFDVVAASDKIGFAKPDPRAYGYVLNKLDVKPQETVMVDDLEYQVAGAEAAGMHAIHYQNLDQLKEDLRRILDGNV